MSLARKFQKVDTLRSRLNAAEAELKAEIKVYAQQHGFSVPPRPEQVRSMINA